MKYSILITDLILNDYINLFKKNFIVDCLWQKKIIDYNKYEALIATGGFNSDKKFLKKFKNLKIISVFGVGYDGIDINYCKKNNIIVTNTPNVLTKDVADLALGLMISLSRKIHNSHKYVIENKWMKKQFELTDSLSNKIVGIVGLGSIGKEFSIRAKSLSMNVVYTGPRKKNVNIRYFNNLIKMAKIVDYLVITCIGGKETKNLINKKVINTLNSNAFIINVSRGSVIDEKALLDALIKKKIKGAALDVFNNEPKINNKFKRLKNVLLSPHIGSGTNETRLSMAKLSEENILNFFKNKKTINNVY